MKKKIISALLSLCLIASLLPAVGITAAAAGGALTSGATIQGGETYTISNAAELGYLAAIVNGGQNCAEATFQLLDDIDLNSGYTFTYNAGGYVSVGNGAELFRVGAGGTGYSAGLYYTTGGTAINAGTQGSSDVPFYVANDNAVSFFIGNNSTPDYTLNAWTPIGYGANNFSGVFDGGGHTVCGLFINNAGLIYQGLFGYISSATIQDLNTAGVVIGNWNVGSIVGNALNSSISNCTSIGAVAGENAAIGGICGDAYQTTIGSCANTGAVNGTNAVGGIVGSIAVGSVTHCVNSGGISCTNLDSGGIAGESQVTVANCYNRGSVSTAGNYSGGIVGDNYGLVENSYSTGAISSPAESGGLVGNNYAIGAVKNSYWLSGTANNGVGHSESGTYLSGCGTFIVGGGITAGTAASCGTDQTLLYGNDLLSALNFWVVRQNSASYRKWTEDIGNTNDGYPVFGDLLLQKLITQQPASSNNYTMSTTNVPGVMKTPQWYKFEAASSVPATDITKDMPEWDILSAARPGGFGMTTINYHYAWTSSDGVYTSGNGGHGLSYSAMSIPVEVSGGKDISFEWKVSSEPGCDILYSGLFQYNGTSGKYELVSGTSISSINGEVCWTAKTYSGLADGTYYLAFLYFKDPRTDSGSDCGQVRLTGTDEILSSQYLPTLDTAGLTPGERFRCRMSYDDGIILFSDNVMFLLPSAVPAVASATVAKTAATQASVSYTLTSPLTGTWNVYNALTDGSLVAGVTASATGTTLTLSHATDIPVGTYYVSLTEAGKAESTRLALTVTPYSPPAAVPAAPPANNNTIVIVDNKDYSIGTENKNDQNTTATVNQTKLTDEITKASDRSSVIFPVSTNTNVTAQLVVKNVEDMAKKDMILTVKTGNVSYNLNTSAIDTSKITSSLGNADSKGIPFNVSIANSNAVVNGATVVVSPMEFTITATYNGKTVTVDTFSSFVNRTLEITADQAKQVTTAVVVESDGSLRHVPTKVTVMDGKYYAVINSLTNSTYTLIWHPTTFADVANHWAKDAIDDMGSRTVVAGVGNGNYEPDRNITRAEFAAIVIRALGLNTGMGSSSFTDVASDAWYYGYIQTAVGYGIIDGYGDGTFGPRDTITREQAMTMIARAMKITKLSPTLTDTQVASLFSKYTDVSGISNYAKASVAACIDTGVVLGRPDNTVSPKDFVTRAEVAVIVERMLQKSNLI